MTARILDGTALAAEILHEVAERSTRLRERGVQPQLTFVLIGSSPPARMYFRRLEKLAAPLGILVTRHELADQPSELDLVEQIAALNADRTVDGILVQMPLPERLVGADISQVIDRRKDVEGITVQNAGRLYLGLPGNRPPTALAMMQLLERTGFQLEGKHAVVVGRSNIVGHPLLEMLFQQGAIVTVTHRQGADLGALTRQADVLMIGVGVPKLVSEAMVKPGVVIVDAGINVTPEGVVGDVDFADVSRIASAITPVPGGVGPVTNAVLLGNLIESTECRGE